MDDNTECLWFYGELLRLMNAMISIEQSFNGTFLRRSLCMFPLIFLPQIWHCGCRNKKLKRQISSDSETYKGNIKGNFYSFFLLLLLQLLRLRMQKHKSSNKTRQRSRALTKQITIEITILSRSKCKASNETYNYWGVL